MTSCTSPHFDSVALDRLLSSIGHNRLLGHRYHAHGQSWVELAMPWKHDLIDDEATGAISAGSVTALMDNAAGTAVWLKRGGLLPQVTIDLRVDFLRPSEQGAELVGRCECTTIAGSIAFVRGIGYDVTTQDPVCLVSATFMLLEGAGR